MKQAIVNLNEEDLVAIAAYVSSRVPKGGVTTAH
jgi:cytochrome c553